MVVKLTSFSKIGFDYLNQLTYVEQGDKMPKLSMLQNNGVFIYFRNFDAITFN